MVEEFSRHDTTPPEFQELRTGGRQGPLSGYRVLSLENFLAGNHATYLMSMLGAEIVKVEQPGVGDALRTIGPFLATESDTTRTASELRTMGNKRSIALNVRSERGRQILLDLAAQSDVFFTNQKPSSLQESMGIDFEILQKHNPKIVYTTLSGFGHDDVVAAGPYGDWPAFDIIAQGLAGLQFRAGGVDDEPGYNGLALGDELTSILCVLGTVSALLERQRSGEAQRVDVAMHDAMVFINQLTLGTWTILGRQPPRGRSGTSAPYGSFRTQDGWVNIAVGGDAIWARFCEAMQRPELATDEAWSTSAARTAKIDELDALVTAWTQSMTTDEAVGRLREQNVPSAPVFTIPEVCESPQVQARQMLVTMQDSLTGPQRVIGNPIKMNSLDNSAVPAQPPQVGGDTRELLAGLLNCTPDDIRQLVQDGVVAEPPGSDGGAGSEFA